MDEKKRQTERDENEPSRFGSKADVRSADEESIIGGGEITADFTELSGTVYEFGDVTETVDNPFKFVAQSQAPPVEIVDATVRPVKPEEPVLANARKALKREMEEKTLRQIIDGALADVERVREATKREQAETDRLRDETRSIISKLLAA